MIVGIYGAIGEGKDTFTDFFIKHSNTKFENRKFAEKLKQIVAVFTGVDRNSLELEDFKNELLPGNLFIHPITQTPLTYRELLQYFGTDLFRNYFDTNVWVKSLMMDYKSDSNFVVSDMRFENEYSSIKERGGTTILVRRTKTVDDWLGSIHFKDCLIPGSKEYLLKELGGTKITKQQLVDELILRELLNNSQNSNKLTHPSERILWDLWVDGKVTFDYVIDNDGTLEEFESKVSNIAKLF